ARDHQVAQRAEHAPVEVPEGLEELLHRVAEVADRVVHRLPAGVAELAVQDGRAILAASGYGFGAAVGWLAAHAGSSPGDGGGKGYGRVPWRASSARAFARPAPAVHPVRPRPRELAWTDAISSDAWPSRRCCRWRARRRPGRRGGSACCRSRCGRATPWPW